MEPGSMVTVAALAGRISGAVAREVSGAWARLGEREREAVLGLAGDAATVVLARVRGTWSEDRWRREWAQIVAQVTTLTAVVGSVVVDSFVAAVEKQVEELTG